MRILRLVSENVKRIVLVDMRPIADVVEITGKNGAGKSSLIDSVQYLFGGLKVIPTDPVRDGADEMNIMAELGDGEKVELVVKRMQSKDGETTRLLVESAKGARHDAPQRVLDAMRTSLSFDPYEFSRMNAGTQLETLRKMVPLEINLNEYDSDTLRIEETRTGVGRDAKALRARVDAYQIGPDWPAQAEDVGALLRDMEGAAARNQVLEQKSQARTGLIAKRATLSKQLADVHGQIAQLKDLADAIDSSIAKLDIEREGWPELPAFEDVASIRETIEAAQKWNEKVRLRTEAQNLEVQCVAKETEYETLTENIESRRAFRRGVIARAPMPVPGLAFGEKEVLFDGHPLEQASDAQKLRVSLGIAMAQNGKLRVILIKNGEKCDKASMAIIREMAAARNYQVLMERVDEGGKTGVYLEDGIVKSVDETMATALI